MRKESSRKEFNGDIPVLKVEGKSIPEAWENSVVELYNNGGWYRRKDSKDKGRIQVDSTMTITIKNPDSDLFMHKYAGCGIEAMLEYQMEILGAKDSWVVNMYDPENDLRWAYHYHQRLATYPSKRGHIDQIAAMINGLSKKPHSRRNMAITWVPEKDIGHQDPPCLQSIWLFIAPAEKDSFKLNMNYYFRSRNVMTAAHMNMVGLYALQCYIREQVAEKTGMNLKNGRIVDINDSYHVSARDQPLLKGFIKRLSISKAKEETVKDRAFNRNFAFGYMGGVRTEVEEKITEQTRRRFEERLQTQIDKIKQISDYLGKDYKTTK